MPTRPPRQPQKAGEKTALAPATRVKFSPTLQTESLTKNLKVTGAAESGSEIVQRLAAAQASGRPVSQLRPAPSPRRVRALPKPTSTTATMVIGADLPPALGSTVGSAAGAFTTFGALVGLGRAGTNSLKTAGAGAALATLSTGAFAAGLALRTGAGAGLGLADLASLASLAADGEDLAAGLVIFSY